MNETTRKMIEERKELIWESGIETLCPRCPNNKAELIKSENFLIIDCPKCGFSMGSRRTCA